MAVEYTPTGTPRLEIGEALHEYQVNTDTYIGTKLFPLTAVAKQAASYPVVTRKSLTARAATERAVRSNYNRTGFEVEDFDYACKEHGLEGQLGEEEIKLYKSQFDAEMETSKDVFNKVLREQEIRIATLAMSETTFDDSTVFQHASGLWATAATNIIKDVQDAKLKGFNLTGMELGTLTVNRATLKNMLLNDDIRDAIKYVVTAEWEVVQRSLAAVLGVEQILVGHGVYDSKPEGATAASLTQIWSSTYALLSITPMGGNLIQPSLGRTFNWIDDSPANAMVESYMEPQTRSTIFRVRQNTDEEIIEKEFGQLIDVTATS